MAKDLRSFLDKLSAQQDLARVRKEVDPCHEVAAVLKRGAEEEGPALFFERVKSSKIPLVGNVLAARRRPAMALGTSVADLLSLRPTDSVIGCSLPKNGETGPVCFL